MSRWWNSRCGLLTDILSTGIGRPPRCEPLARGARPGKPALFRYPLAKRLARVSVPALHKPINDKPPERRGSCCHAAWSGMCIDMAKDIAANFDGTVEYIESTYGNSVLDLQANKIDLAFALNPTPKRALVIDFTHPFYLHGFGMVGKKGFRAENWSDLNKPEVKVAVDIGSVHEIAARRFAPKATIIALKARDDCILAVQTGRADCVILAVNLGLTAVKKN